MITPKEFFKREEVKYKFITSPKVREIQIETIKEHLKRALDSSQNRLFSLINGSETHWNKIGRGVENNYFYSEIKTNTHNWEIGFIINTKITLTVTPKQYSAKINIDDLLLMEVLPKIEGVHFIKGRYQYKNLVINLKYPRSINSIRKKLSNFRTIPLAINVY